MTLPKLSKILLYVVVIGSLVAVMWHIWSMFRRHWLLTTIVGGGTNYILITTGLWKVVLIAVASVIVIALLIKLIHDKLGHNPLWASVAMVGLVLVLAGTGLYFLKTNEVQQPKQIIGIENARYYIDDGLLTKTYYMQYQAVPTNAVKADAVYCVVIDNGATGWEDKLVWTQLGRDTREPKVIEHKVTEAEYLALSKSSWYETTIYEVELERNILYLWMPAIYAGIIGLVVMVRRECYGGRKRGVIYQIR